MVLDSLDSMFLILEVLASMEHVNPKQLKPETVKGALDF